MNLGSRCWLTIVLGHLILCLYGSVAQDQNRQQQPQQQQQGKSCKKDYQFDNLVMSIQWPLSFCYEKQECNLQVARQKQWNIHGLWPNRVPKRGGARGGQSNNNNRRTRRQQEQQRRGSGTNGGSNAFSDLDISFCCGPRYDQSLVSARLLKELQKKWPTLQSSGNNNNFWRHEWQKHGTCARGIAKLRNQTSYFESSLKLYDQFDLKQLQFESGKRYSIDEFHRHIEPLVGGKRVRIECSLAKVPNDDQTGAAGSAGSSQTTRNQTTSIFSEFHICLNKELRPIDCTRNDDYQCKRSILFP